MRREALVVVGAYATRTEAELAQGALEADGLATMIAADDVGGQYAAIWPASVRLLVRADDARRATYILQQTVRPQE